MLSRIRGVISRAFDTPQPHWSPKVEHGAAILSLLSPHGAEAAGSWALAWAAAPTLGRLWGMGGRMRQPSVGWSRRRHIGAVFVAAGPRFWPWRRQWPPCGGVCCPPAMTHYLQGCRFEGGVMEFLMLGLLAAGAGLALLEMFGSDSDQPPESAARGRTRQSRSGRSDRWA